MLKAGSYSRTEVAFSVLSFIELAKRAKAKLMIVCVFIIPASMFYWKERQNSSGDSTHPK